MSIAEIIALAGVGVCAVGIVYSMIKNGRAQATRDGGIKAELVGVKEKLDHPQDGLSAIRRAQGDMQIHCAKITSSFSERIFSLEENRGKKRAGE